jgi:hypothetical protein
LHTGALVRGHRRIAQRGGGRQLGRHAESCNES